MNVANAIVRTVKAFHGTSSKVMQSIESGTTGARPQRVFREANASLGGTYVTNRQSLAAVHAKDAARVLGGHPVIVEVDVDPRELLPDEDWVVDVAEQQRVSGRHQAFLDDLFKGYLGEGFSLSDHYKLRYAKLNDEHGITWRDSWRTRGTARLARPLRPKDVL